MGPVFMPDGRPAPELMTEEEAIQFLRLDIDGPANPNQTLQYYRSRGVLKATRIGKHLRYSKQELLKFIEVMTDQTKGSRKL